MNDETTSQLTTTWRVPAYARDLLWLTTDSGSALAQGEQGLFSLPAPADVLTLRWGSADGPALRQFRWHSDSLVWDGSVALGGYIEALHIAELPGVDEPVVIATLDAQPVRPGTLPYPAAAHRRQPIPRPDFFAGIAQDCDPTLTTWLIAADSLLAGSLHDALNNRLRLYVFGRLPDDRAGWHRHLALPLLLEALTLFPV